MSQAISHGLTSAQREAVEHAAGPLLILAGPGSGKTRVITHRIARLLSRDIPSHQILALTFTNKAADEMKARVERLAPRSNVWMGTFHKFCARLLRQHAPLVGIQENYTIYDSDDSSRALKLALDRIDIPNVRFTPDQIGSIISWAKNNLLTPDKFESVAKRPLEGVAAKIYPIYQQTLLEANAVDFDDLLLHVACLLRENPEVRSRLDRRYRYIMVDEYQDTNLAQYAIVRALSIDEPNLAVTGDPDQSIYSWRGANIANILEFEKDYPTAKVVRLERNYRSTQRILRVADALIRNNEQRKDKELYTENDEGSPVRLTRYTDARVEAEMIVDEIAHEIQAGRRSPSDYSIFYRANALSRPLELAFRSAGIPFQIVHGLEFFQRAEIKNVMAYLHLLNNPKNDVAFLRTVNIPPRGIGKATLEKLLHYARHRRGSLIDAAREAGLIDGLPKRAAMSLKKFIAMQDSLTRKIDGTLEKLMEAVLEESGYKQMLADADREEDHNRLANIEELISVAREYDEQTAGKGSLEEFLEELGLRGDTDDLLDNDDRVTIMTLHAAKGLEFPVVYIIALEEGLIPHERSKHSDTGLEEERRLLFVGITRAKEELRLSSAHFRDYRGQRRMTVMSSFTRELPVEEITFDDHSAGLSQRPATPPRSVNEYGEPADEYDDYSHETSEEEICINLRDGDDSDGSIVTGEEEYVDDDTRAKETWTVRESQPKLPHDESRKNKNFDRINPYAAEAAAAAQPIWKTAAEMTAAEATDEQSASLKKTASRVKADALARLARERDLGQKFRVGMLVEHPEYGVGRIVGISGSGDLSCASILFAGRSDEKKFILGKSRLTPVDKVE